MISQYSYTSFIDDKKFYVLLMIFFPTIPCKIVSHSFLKVGARMGELIHSSYRCFDYYDLNNCHSLFVDGNMKLSRCHSL